MLSLEGMAEKGLTAIPKKQVFESQTQLQENAKFLPFYLNCYYKDYKLK